MLHDDLALGAAEGPARFDRAWGASPVTPGATEVGGF